MTREKKRARETTRADVAFEQYAAFSHTPQIRTHRKGLLRFLRDDCQALAESRDRYQDGLAEAFETDKCRRLSREEKRIQSWETPLIKMRDESTIANLEPGGSAVESCDKRANSTKRATKQSTSEGFPIDYSGRGFLSQILVAGSFHASLARGVLSPR
jgi:hypothetical protein